MKYRLFLHYRLLSTSYGKSVPMYIIEGHRRIRNIAPSFLILELNGGEWSKQETGHFTLGKEPGIH
jgi:hypothetical protein